MPGNIGLSNGDKYIEPNQITTLRFIPTFLLKNKVFSTIMFIANQIIADFKYSLDKKINFDI